MDTDKNPHKIELNGYEVTYWKDAKPCGTCERWTRAELRYGAYVAVFAPDDGRLSIVLTMMEIAYQRGRVDKAKEMTERAALMFA